MLVHQQRLNPRLGGRGAELLAVIVIAQGAVQLHPLLRQRGHAAHELRVVPGQPLHKSAVAIHQHAVRLQTR